MVSDSDVAQDVAQDTFLKAYRALPGFRGDAAFRTWLLTIAANAARGALRRSGRRRETGIEAVAPVASEDASPEDEAVMADEAARARTALDELPEKQRLSIQLRVDQGLSFREIGDIIGSSEGAARVNYFHGIRRLREMMG
jgi:RNA polymerase sigma-70 factor (ECF subfamily)